MRKILRVGLALTSVVVAAWFVYALTTDLKVRNESKLSCDLPVATFKPSDFSYFQLSLRDQHPTEPYFNGDMFLNLGNAAGKDPLKVSITRSAGGTFAQSLNIGELQYDLTNSTLWMNKPVDLRFIRLSGSHMNFPFDSAKFDFNITLSPSPRLTHVLIRNLTSSFYLPLRNCICFKGWGDRTHVAFELRRNPLVVLTAVVLIMAATAFLFTIVLFLKSESLPMAIASFFFSLWSIRAILSSEMKTFPTYFNLAILSLCVLLMVCVGLNFLLRDMRVR